MPNSAIFFAKNRKLARENFLNLVRIDYHNDALVKKRKISDGYFFESEIEFSLGVVPHWRFPHRDEFLRQHWDSDEGIWFV